jgi:hypothetical protein
MSPDQVVSGPSGLKSRRTRSDAAVAPRSWMVVRTLVVPHSPTQPLRRINRATRLRDTR